MNTATDFVIQTDGLTRRFGDFTAVDNLQLNVPGGAIYGFLGPNGSGKSTTIRMLCGLLIPSEGRATVLGMSVPEDAGKLKHRIGYMTQKFSLYEDLSVTENLEFVGSIYGLSRSGLKQKVQSSLKEYNLLPQAKQKAGTLSGGQKQRLALAAAVIHDPDLLLLDEPTSAVDPKSRRDFWETLFDLASTGTTILVSTHYMDEAERCHRLAILDHGRKVADGSPNELAANINRQIFEVVAPNPERARQKLAQLEDVGSITQLGQRLRLIVPGDADNVEHYLHQALGEESETSIRSVTPNLEDVFVVVTEKPTSLETAA